MVRVILSFLYFSQLSFLLLKAVNTILEVKARYELGGGDWSKVRPKSSYKRI